MTGRAVAAGREIAQHTSGRNRSHYGPFAAPYGVWITSLEAPQETTKNSLRRRWGWRRRASNRCRLTAAQGVVAGVGSSETAMAGGRSEYTTGVTTRDKRRELVRPPMMTMASGE